MPPRFFKHGELPLVLIALVDQSPRHGYEIMAELKRLFGPRYRPSPGSIYPAIEALQTEGLIVGYPVGDKVVYEPTPRGRQSLADRAEMLAALELRSGVMLGEGESLEALLTRFKARLSPLSGRVDPLAAEAVLERAAQDIESLEPTRSRRGKKSHAR
ncbi:MAG: PadR family transcriptional regulator [Solirubrobacteraceae bacterium]|nr:PadR family transcriptional regulator [Solirubrobacteraceae bacterium]